MSSLEEDELDETDIRMAELLSTRHLECSIKNHNSSWN